MYCKTGWGTHKSIARWFSAFKGELAAYGPSGLVNPFSEFWEIRKICRRFSKIRIIEYQDMNDIQMPKITALT